MLRHIVSLTLVMVAGLSAQRSFGQDLRKSESQSVVILATKGGLQISVGGKMPEGTTRKTLESDGLLIRCDTCDVNQRATTPLSFRCRGNVLVEGSHFTIRCEEIAGDGSRLLAVGSEGRSAELWLKRDGKVAFFAASRLVFDSERGTVEAEDAKILDLGPIPGR